MNTDIHTMDGLKALAFRCLDDGGTEAEASDLFMKELRNEPALIALLVEPQLQHIAGNYLARMRVTWEAGRRSATVWTKDDITNDGIGPAKTGADGGGQDLVVFHMRNAPAASNSIGGHECCDTHKMTAAVPPQPAERPAPMAAVAPINEIAGTFGDVDGVGLGRNDPQRGCAHPSTTLPVQPSPPEPVTGTRVYAFGREVLGNSAGGMITNLIRHFGGGLNQTFESLQRAAQMSEPRAYIGKILSGASQGQGKAGGHNPPVHQITGAAGPSSHETPATQQQALPGGHMDRDTQAEPAAGHPIHETPREAAAASGHCRLATQHGNAARPNSETPPANRAAGGGQFDLGAQGVHASPSPLPASDCRGRDQYKSVPQGMPGAPKIPAKVGGAGQKILGTHALPARPTINPGRSKPLNPAAMRLVNAAVSRSILDTIKLADGLPLRKATVEQADAHANLANREASFIKLVIHGLPHGSVIGDFITDIRADALWRRTEDLRPIAAPVIEARHPADYREVPNAE